MKSGTIVDATIIAAPPSTKNRAKARGEHPFRVIKRLWGFTKVRYRGIAKNLARARMAFALANVYALRRKLMPPEASCVW